MPWDNDAYNSTRSITALVKAACASKNLLIPSPLSFHDVARLIEVDQDESVSPREDQDDPLAQELCDAAIALEYTERSDGVETTVSVSDSMAALFDRSSAEARALKPRLFIAWRMQGDSQQSIAARLLARADSRRATVPNTAFPGWERTRCSLMWCRVEASRMQQALCLCSQRIAWSCAHER
jgi:hypothetical protein